MENQITIREAITENDVAVFWDQLHTYHKRDIFPHPDSEDLEYFLGSEYYDHMMKIHSRPKDRCYFLFFHRDRQDIGFAMPVIYTTEDGKCFIMEYCVYPEFRGNGTGKECARVLLDWAKEHGALYAELNHGSNERRRHFWETIGFIENGADEWGEPLMILPPAEDVPITVEVLADPEDWQLKKLENGFLKEIGESPATEEKQEQLAAIRRIREAGLLEKLPGKLKQAAIAREEYPSASLSELAAMMDPPITKPAMNNRMKKLIQTAREVPL